MSGWKTGRRLRGVLVVLLGFPVAGFNDVQSQGRRSDPNVVYDPALVQALAFRNVGPSRGGRVKIGRAHV